MLLASVVFAGQADRSGTEALARRADERLQALQREADQLASDERTLLNELRALELQRQIKATALERLGAEADDVAAELTSATQRIEALEARDAVERPDVRARLVEIYKRGRGSYLRLLLSTADARQLGRASRMVATLAQADRRRLAEHQRTLEALKSARSDLAKKSRALQALRTDADRADRAAAAASRARADLVQDIDRRRELNAQLSGELQGAQQKLQSTLRDLSNGAAVAESPTLPIRPFRGALDWPLAGTVRRRFDDAAGTRSAQSSGVEIAAAEGTEVRAVHDGTVAYADSFTGFGKLIIVDHGAQTFSLYGDLRDLAVARGARIKRGDPVGTVGNAPAGPPGLYFELRVDGRPVDPLQWLKKR